MSTLRRRNGKCPGGPILCQSLLFSISRAGNRKYLEAQSSLDLLCQHLCDDTVEGSEHSERDLRLHAPVSDEVVEGVGQRGADASVA